MKTYGNLLCGGGGESGQVEVRSPWSGEVVGRVPAADRAAIDGALELAESLHLDHDRRLPPAKRIEVLSKAADLMAARAEELALQAAAEGGKPLVDSRVELARAVDGLRSCVECLRTAHGEEIPMNLNAASAGRLALTRREPIGAVLAYSAFNHPMNLIVHQAAPAIAAGCPVVVKPADVTPLSCFAFVELLREAGLPPEYCQAFVAGLDVIDGVASSPRIGFFSFIGSGKVGWMLRGRLAPGVRCALEHGGAAPVVIAEDADLDDALPLIAKGGFYHAGQVCVSVQRVFAPRALAREVAERLGKLGGAMTVGDPTSADTDVGPLIRHGEVDRVESWVNEAVAEGADCVAGGKRLSDCAYGCTVLLDPPDDAKVSREEIFGPVICVYSCDSLDDAVARANALPFSFQSSVLTRDIDTAMHCARKLEAAAVMINDHTAFRVDWMPFAGHRTSGYGTGGIRYTFEDMQAEKLLVLRSRGL